MLALVSLCCVLYNLSNHPISIPSSLSADFSKGHHLYSTTGMAGLSPKSQNLKVVLAY